MGERSAGVLPVLTSEKRILCIDRYTEMVRLLCRWEKDLRACCLCGLLKNERMWLEFGCENCPFLIDPGSFSSLLLSSLELSDTKVYEP